MEKTLLDQYEAGTDLPARAIARLTAAELDAVPATGGWTIRQIVAHLADSEVIASERIRRIIAQDNPTLLAYDQEAFARALHYDRIDAALAAELFRLNRQVTTTILRALPASAFERAGTHSETGRVTLADLVRSYVKHVNHHVAIIQQKRRALGKPL